MTGWPGLARLLPHQGASLVLDGMLSHDAFGIVCTADSHLSPANPLRFRDRLHPVCAAEYGMQAAALHGALLAGGERPMAGYLVSVRDLAWAVDRLDDPAIGRLRVAADRLAGTAAGQLYRFALTGAGGRAVARGQAMVALHG